MYTGHLPQSPCTTALGAFVLTLRNILQAYKCTFSQIFWFDTFLFPPSTFKFACDYIFSWLCLSMTEFINAMSLRLICLAKFAQIPTSKVLFLHHHHQQSNMSVYSWSLNEATFYVCPEAFCKTECCRFLGVSKDLYWFKWLHVVCLLIV